MQFKCLAFILDVLIILGLFFVYYCYIVDFKIEHHTADSLLLLLTKTINNQFILDLTSN